MALEEWLGEQLLSLLEPLNELGATCPRDLLDLEGGDIDDLLKDLDEEAKAEFHKRMASLCEAVEAEAAAEAQARHDRSIAIDVLEVDLRSAISVDFAVVMDCTKSMSSYITSTKTKIIELVSEIAKMVPDVPLRLSFVAYRDHWIERGGRQRPEHDMQLEVLPFTTDIETFQAFVRGQAACGGGPGGLSWAEDVLGGLKAAAELGWSSPTRLLYHIGDAPCHGIRFHGLPGDRFPCGDPRGLTPERVLPALHDQDIKYLFGRIKGDKTDKMIREFNEIMRQATDDEFLLMVKTVDVSPASFMQAASDTLTSSNSTLIISASRSSRTGEDSKGPTKDYEIVDGEPTWPSIRAEPGTCYHATSPSSIVEIIGGTTAAFFASSGLVGTFKIAECPFAQGEVRYAFYAQQNEGGTFEAKIQKEFKAQDAERNTFAKYQEALFTHIAAKFLADEFNKVKPGECESITYCEASIVEYHTREPPVYVMQEEKLPGEQHYKKFSSNTGYVAPGEDYAAIAAFSHWTFHASSGELMVTDLQGVKGRSEYKLTDPAIHCTDLCRFGGTNLGKNGFRKFFATHFCNNYCRHLKLPPPSAANSETSDWEHISGVTTDTASSFFVV